MQRKCDFAHYSWNAIPESFKCIAAEKERRVLQIHTRCHSQRKVFADGLSRFIHSRISNSSGVPEDIWDRNGIERRFAHIELQ